MLAPTLVIKDAHLDYDGHLLFDHLNLVIPGGTWTCLLGPSGVGKTSLLRLIAGLKTSARSPKPIETSDKLPLQGRIAYLAQNELLLPWLTVIENVMIGARLRGQKIDSGLYSMAQEIVKQVGLQPQVNRYPHQLSGGMKQKVLLARTLFENKPVILMDEPFAALDVITRTGIQELAAELLSTQTVLLITHDPFEALRLGHQIYVMAGKPAVITTQIQLPGNPPRELTDPLLLRTHAKLLDTLSHAKEVMAC